jgi:hypothetical protein
VLIALTQRLFDHRTKVEQTANVESDIPADGLRLSTQRHELAEATQRSITGTGMTQEEGHHLERVGRVERDHFFPYSDFVLDEASECRTIQDTTDAPEERDVVRVAEAVLA